MANPQNHNWTEVVEVVVAAEVDTLVDFVLLDRIAGSFHLMTLNLILHQDSGALQELEDLLVLELGLEVESHLQVENLKVTD